MHCHSKINLNHGLCTCSGKGHPVVRTSGQALLEVVGRYPSGETEVDTGYGKFSSSAMGAATDLMNWREGSYDSEMGPE
jgi:hypothetical protein